MPNAEKEATDFVQSNPGIETELSVEQCTEELISGFADAADWKDPARYGAS